MISHTTDRGASAGLRLPGIKPSDQNWRQYLDQFEHFVAEHPGVCLASAFAMGVALAWLIKRR
jgi:hypothetical protein